MITAEFDEQIAERMRVEHRVLAARWFERLLDLLPVDAREIFPTESLLDHIPSLILEISRYIGSPEEDAIAANTAILDKARELGALRHQQRASLHQVLREYQVLNGVLVAFVMDEMEAIGPLPIAAAGIALVHRLNQAVTVLSQFTVESFVTLYTQTIAEQNERLEQFTRMAAHEWRQPLGAVQFGVGMLRSTGIRTEQAERTLAAVERNVQHLVDLTRKLESIARMRDGSDNAVLQEVPASTVAHEAARQIREMADARGVVVAVADDMPTLVVDVGRLEVVFVNLLSNAVKYSDPQKTDRRVEIDGSVDDAGWCCFEVRDNGVGIPAAALDSIFERFTRAHAHRDDLVHVGGIGLGLAITDDCVRHMGGQIEVRSVEGEGTVFIVRLPATPPQA